MAAMSEAELDELYRQQEQEEIQQLFL